ncbi:MAG TPA: hypothetical protein VFQ85_00720 [Mycobacteriales bacterium]|jgi:hypothetical protein|nr:hypothetical protein [Mycobacteriales bacterium]
MRLQRPVLAGLVLGSAVLPVTAASAATGVTAAGQAVSSATIASISVGSLSAGSTNIDGHTVSIASLAATAQTLTSAAPAVSFVPITLDGAKTGAVTVTPANSPQTVGGIATSALPLNVLYAKSPAATLTATKAPAGPAATVAASLGEAKILNLPIALNGSVNVGSMTSSAQSQAGKTLKITNVSLPSIADILAGLGIDIAKLPVETLNALVEQLPVMLTSTGLAAFNLASGAVDDAQAAVTDAQADVASATTDLADATAALDTLLAPLTLDHTDWDALDGPAKDTLIAANGGVNGALANAATAYDAAQAAMTAAQKAYTDAVAALPAAISALVDAVTAILDGTPLVSVGAAEVGTKALVGSAKTAAVTGYVSGVKVLGEDVLNSVTGSSKLDVAKLVGDTANQVNATIAATTATLSEILSSATGATGLSVPAPSVQLMSKSTSTGTDGAFGTANAAVTALKISLGSATVPDAFALTGAAGMPGIIPTSTGFKTAALGVQVGTLAESARFRPGTVTTPGSTTNQPGSTPTMPSTGVPAGLGVLAGIGTGLALGARRRMRLAPQED